MPETAEAPPPAGPDRRFYAFLLDRLLAWGGYAAAAWAAYVLIDRDHVVGGVAVIVAAVLLAWMLSSVALGLWGLTPGKAMLGLRVHGEDGEPIGVPRALLRTLVLGAATLPTLGFGAAALAWTALADPSGDRRGWHDRRAGSVVVDVRPPVVEHESPVEQPRPVVNLTAMRLVPASPTPPARIPEPPTAPPVPVSAPSAPSAPAAPSVTPRQGLGWPLVGAPPTAHPGVPTTPPPRRPPPPPPPPPPPAGRPAPGGARTMPGGPAPGAGWRVSFDTGESFIVEGLTLVGRRPEARPGEPARQLVSLPSDDMSLSKTHAQFQVVPDGALVVMDRGSTNGSILIRSGVTRHLSGGRPATLRHGDRVRFGDREMTVALEE
jgi:uncharacterized RDD family membrane protein YckC